MFPIRYHGSLFVGDWAQGRILDVRIKRQGASYAGEVHVFLEGNPLNVTDMEVGPDGMLYFCTGGRGTEGGVYRVGWNGRVPPQIQDLGTGIEVALRQPQLQTAWARQQVALIKEELGEQWEDELLSILLDETADAAFRVRAIDLLQLYGPQPTPELLVELSRDRDRRIRSKTAYFLGLHSNPVSKKRLEELLSDPNVVVKRTACESLARIGGDTLPVEKLVSLLGHGDRHLAWAASKTLQNLPVEAWKNQILDTEQQRTFLVGSAALLGTGPSKEVCLEVFQAANKWMDSFVADREFLDLLRVMQLALMQGKINSQDISDAARQIASEFPSGNTIINRELVRLLAYLESSLVATRYIDYLKSGLPLEDKTHLMTHAPFIAKSWTPDEQFEILQLIAELQKDSTSESHTRYLDEAARRFVSKMDTKEHQLVLDRGVEWPGAALGAIAFLPKHPDHTLLDKLIRLDRDLVDQDGEAVSRLRIGIAAVLARSGRDQEMAYLRELFENEPERRDILAVALAQQTEGANWPLLIRALATLEDGYAVAVMAKLGASSQVCEEPQVFRHVILQGLSQNQDVGRRFSTALLEKWTGENPAEDASNESEKISAWQNWFRSNYPDLSDPVLPEESDLDRYTFDELEEYLDSDDALAASPEQGRIVYAKADCIKCHRFGEIGGGVGPDLSSVGKRFQKKELLQSILYPSHFISDQYSTKTVATASGRTFNGVIKEKKDGSVVVLDPEGNEVFVAAEDIDEIVPNKKSTMPTGLLNELSLEDIASLFAFLNKQSPAKISRKLDRKSSDR
jgi:putative heme-binding domain-containing protein